MILQNVSAIYLFIAFSTILLASGHASARPWADVTSQAGIEGYSISRLKFADLNGDRRPDIILLPDSAEGERPRIHLNTGTESGESPAFRRLETGPNLPPLRTGDVLVFADLDNDGHQDAILGRYLDIYQEDYQRPASGPYRSAWFPGNGDGTFGEPRIFSEATMATTRAIAVGDVNEDGLPDCYFGNWYRQYSAGYEGFANDLLLQYEAINGDIAFTRWPVPEQTLPSHGPDDSGGRPTYGVALPRLDKGLPMLLELNYGRRWNRLYQLSPRARLLGTRAPNEPKPPLILREPAARADHLVRQLRGRDIAPEVGVDGDAIRHGRHPKWPGAHADARPRSRRPDEPPFRSNGNTFDAAVGDIDNDGDFDLLLTTIIHAWAGESSDRSRFLVNQLKETGELEFFTFERLSIDRIPEQPAPGEPLQPHHTQYNQGDIYAELADLNHDGRLDLVLCSSDYPDPPPHDERLRIYFQQKHGRFANVTKRLGIDHVGAGMPSLADVDGDGDLDLLVGQSFNRLPRELRRQAAVTSGALEADAPEDAPARPRARLFINNSSEKRRSVVFYLRGDPEQGVARDALGAIVRLTADLDNDPATPDVTQSRQLIGPGGHAGKQSANLIHFGLGSAKMAKRIEVQWPGKGRPVTILENVDAGRFLLDQSEGRPRSLDP